MVLDATVMANYVLGVEPSRQELAELFGSYGPFFAPDLWRPELSNAFWKYIRVRRITLEESLEWIILVERVLSDTVSSQKLIAPALVLAYENNHSAYDCFYLALAQQRKTQVITYDRALQSKFPGLAVAPRSILT